MKVTKEFKFDMSHMLAGHPGLCKNLHGHTYKLEVTVEDELVDGMVIDFKDLKNIVNGLIVDKCDHAFMYNQLSNDDAEHDVARVLNEHHKKVVKTNFRPTAENMVIWIFGVLFHDGDLNIKKIRLYETPTSYAEATLSDLAGVDERVYTAE
ncbi:MAG: 6-carboxytetrahydropterin synthase QueD [Halanaerobiales bacterium]